MIVGVDCGLTGAVSFIDEMEGTYFSVVDIPISQSASSSRKVKNEINPSGLREIFSTIPVPSIAVVERTSAMPGQGVSSMFSMGDSFGVVRGVLSALCVPIIYVPPMVWKKHFKIGSDKERARALAISYFPTAPLARKKDHNRAESLLLARWYYETRK